MTDREESPRRCRGILTFLLWALGIAVALISVAALSPHPWITRDYWMVCTRCLESRFYVEEVHYGLVMSRKQIKTKTSPHYESLYHQPCPHVFQKVSWGRTTHSSSGHTSTGCGWDSELRDRNRSVEAIFVAQERVNNPELAREILAVIDQLFPPALNRSDHKKISGAIWPVLTELPDRVESIRTTEDWQDVLQWLNRQAEAAPNRAVDSALSHGNPAAGTNSVGRTSIQ